jgi:hypothetical protein
VSLAPVQVAEQHARRRGYRGAWPPPPRPRIDTAEELRAVLGRLERGELTAHLVAAAGDHLIDFFRQIAPDDFRTLAETLIRIVLYGELPPQSGPGGWSEVPAPRVQIRAVQALVKPMLKVLELLPKLERLQGDPSPVLAHLLECLYAFMAPLGDGRMAQVAAHLLRLGRESGSADTAVRAASAAAELTVAAMTTVVNARLGLERAEKPLDEAARQQARASFAALRARARAQLKGEQEARHAAVAG